MRLPPMTIRRMMVLVLVVAAGLTLFVRHRRFRAIADDHLRQTVYTECLGEGSIIYEKSVLTDHTGRVVADQDRARFWREQSWHQFMYATYDQAARHPYLHAPIDLTADDPIFANQGSAR